MSPWTLALLFATCIASATADVFYDVDWVTAENANKSIPITGPVQRSLYRTGFGVFRHWSSGKFIHIHGNPRCPPDHRKLVIFPGVHYSGSMSFRFVQVIGHYGYLEHTCGKIIHPYGGKLIPDDQTILVMHQDRHAGALFTIDQDNMQLIHRSGKIFHPDGGEPNPKDEGDVVLHRDRHDAARFNFVNIYTLKPIPVFPKPHLSGTWRVIYAVDNPKAHHEYHVTHRVGKSVTKHSSWEYEWKVSAGVSSGWFKASPEFRMLAQTSLSTTWEREITETKIIKVSPGKTVVTWQYFFVAEQFGDGLQFRSTILADTDSLYKQPRMF